MTKIGLEGKGGIVLMWILLRGLGRHISDSLLEETPIHNHTLYLGITDDRLSVK